MKIIQFLIKANGYYPNNPALPVVLYKAALRLPEEDADELVKELFHQHGWNNHWVNGIYPYHHYHSNTHEVLGVIRGQGTVMLGGEKGVRQVLEKGDAIVLPAGVAHRNVESTKDFTVVGAYPDGKEYDMCYGKPDEHPQVDENISKVPLPRTDPLYGANGPLLQHWKEHVLKA